MDCQVCELRSSVGFCVECKMLLCSDCAIVCRHCKKFVCPKHQHRTPHGRVLCVTCMEDRNRRKGAGDKEKEPEPTSFAALMSIERREANVEGAKEDPEASPILVASSYRPPSRAAYVAAFALFGAVGIILFFSIPDLRSIARWPFESKGPTYMQNMRVPLPDRNEIRAVHNVTKLKVMFQVPFFLLTWAAFLASLLGIGVLVYQGVKGGMRWLRRCWAKKGEGG